ncbi:MAG TPA: carboxypeptidase regulatory-like domain-containing protein [Flavipsychrobacter sp.]
MKTCYLIFFLFFASIIGGIDCSGQDDSITVTGLVVDKLNEPIINAMVIVSDNNVTVAEVVTNFDGTYTIQAPKTNNLVLQIRYIGHKAYLKQNITGDIDNLFVTLYEDPDFADIIIPGCIPVPLADIQHCPARTFVEPLLIDNFGSGFTKTITSSEIEKGAY